MDYVKNPKAIEDKSMEIIYDYVKDLGLTDDEVRVVSRTVHASGDVEYAQLVKMSPDAVQKGIEALDNGKIEAVAMDVYETEPKVNLELVNHPMVSPTPHIGASTVEAQDRISKEIVEMLVEYFQDDEQIAL